MRVYNKLVRNKIPDIIAGNGEEPVARKLPAEQFLYFASKKLDEEVAEYHAEPSVEELADIVEIATAIAGALGVTAEQFEAIRRGKAEASGSFSDHILLEEVL